MTERVRELGPNPLKRGQAHPADVWRLDESRVEA
jgi:hypothetical protein